MSITTNNNVNANTPAKSLPELINEYGQAVMTWCDRAVDKGELRKILKGEIGPSVPEGLPEGMAKGVRQNMARFAIAENDAAENAEFEGESAYYAALAFSARGKLDVESAKESAKNAAKAAKYASAASIVDNDGRNLLTIDAQRAKLDAAAARGDAAAAKVDRDRMLAGFSPSQLRAAKNAAMLKV